MASSAAKKVTTGLTGLAVSRTPHYSLSALYNKTLKELSKMPEEAAYRKYTEQTIKDRLAIVATEQDVNKLEEKINCGQVEELIVQAENELMLARRLLKYEPWKPLDNRPPDDQWKWPF